MHNDPINIPVQYLSGDAALPEKAHGDEDAAFDLYSTEGAMLYPNVPQMVSTDVAIAIPRGYVGLVCSRSGLAKDGVIVANAPGVIDPGYRGNVKVILINVGRTLFEVSPHERVAQLLIVPTAAVALIGTHEPLPGGSGRGEGGFGSTGR